MILIVDDDSAMAENCEMLLESYGYEVSVAFNAADALSKIHDRRPDLLISDCCMPDLTGVELSRKLNADPDGCRLPVLLMSGSLQCQVAAGKSYDAFIRKPFLAENFLAEIRKLLSMNTVTPPENKTRQLL